MSVNWYYVLENERIGPVTEDELKKFFEEDVLFEESFVWKKGFDNWKHIQDVEELKYILKKENNSSDDRIDDIPMPSQDLDPVIDEEISSISESPNNAIDGDLMLDLDERDEDDEFTIDTNSQDDISETPKKFDWENLDKSSKIFSLKIGIDREGPEGEYGPYSISFIKRLYSEKRINGKTLLFSPGMDDWMFLADIPIFEVIFSELPPIIDENDRRRATRKPFVARLLFHDNSEVFEGICRDISIGGLQILVAGCPLEINKTISMNVHPDNRETSFVAEGKVVRILEGNLGFSMRFVELSNDAKGAIENYINQN